MRSRTSDWFEIKVRYDKTQEDGSIKPITEQYVVDALSFTEAEGAIIEEMSSYISGDFKITGMKPAAYHEIFFSENPQDDKWYKVKLMFITIDEKTEKEKRTAHNYLVQAGTLQGAVKNMEEGIKGIIADCQFAAVTETMFMDVFEHVIKSGNKPVETDERPEYEQAGNEVEGAE